MSAQAAVRCILALLTGLLALPGLLGPAPRAGAQEACFPQTGQCVQEPFLTYWRTHGGLAIHGYPLSTAGPEQLEDGTTYTVQYFERSRFERHPEHAGTPYEVLLGHFGRAFYPIDPGRPLVTAAAPLPGATYFAATGHNLGGRFLAYWAAHGGLARFGYPISEELRERLEDGREYTVQYFERARFEYHPEYQGTPYEVLLGQLGRRILHARGAPTALPYPIPGAAGRVYGRSAAIRARLGPPAAAAALQVPGAVQLFERGAMLWRGDTRTIDVLVPDLPSGIGAGVYGYGAWLGYADPWAEGQDPGGGPVPGQPGRYYPRRGFGQLWRDRPEVQSLLGYALSEQELAVTLTAQPFLGGAALEAAGACGGLPQPPECAYAGVGLYLLYTSGRIEPRSGGEHLARGGPPPHRRSPEDT